MLTKFAKQFLHILGITETNLYEEFLNEYDGDIYSWLCGSQPLPEKYNLIAGKLGVPCVV